MARAARGTTPGHLSPGELQRTSRHPPHVKNLTPSHPATSVPMYPSGGFGRVASLFSPNLKRLFRYVLPYGFRLGVGVIMVAFVAFAEGMVALMIRPAVDFVLNPAIVTSNLPLVTLPWNNRTIFLDNYFPSRIHNVWTVFAISLVILYISKGVAEYLGTTEIQYVGQAAVKDL